MIIGLGIYGSNLAKDLTDMGHEVIGVDNRKTNIEAVKDYISTVYMIDATEESALALLPLNNVDLVIVAIGENFGASIKVVALLKKLKVKHIYARAMDSLHESILRGFNLSRILTPEQRAARDLTGEMSLGGHILSLTIDDDNLVMKFEAPEQLIGMRYADLNLKKDFDIDLVAVTKVVSKRNIIGISSETDKLVADLSADVIIEKGDKITCFGSRKNYKNFYKHIQSIQ